MQKRTVRVTANQIKDLGPTAGARFVARKMLADSRTHRDVIARCIVLGINENTARTQTSRVANGHV